MYDPTQDYFDVRMSFSYGDPKKVFQLLSEVTKLYGYEVRKTISNTKAIVRFHQSITIGDAANTRIEASVRKFVDVLSIELERIDESAICWWTNIKHIVPTEDQVLTQ